MILVVAEKPSVANTIANVLGVSDKKNGYIEGNGYVVSWCVGHLVSLASPEKYGSQYAEKIWKFEQLPIIPDKWIFEVNQSTKAQYENLKSLMNRQDITEIVCATDAGREGECIFRYVYNLTGSQKPVKRLWTSSLEVSAIQKSFSELKADSCYDNLFSAGIARAKADWLVGMNATRLFSIRHKANLSIGRVQTPTLAMIVDRNYKVTNFVKEKFFTVDLNCGDFIAVSERIDNEYVAKKIYEHCNGKQIVVSDVKREIKTINPPKLYDLTTLQREANRQFGYTAQQTLDYTQSLYEAKLVTYPRTDSQYITSDMEKTVRHIVQVVRQCFPTFMSNSVYFEPDIKRCINDSKVSDHHAIIPTAEILNVNLVSLSTGERNILALISSKLLLATSEPHKYEAVKIIVKCENYTFSATGKTIIEIGFKALEKRIQIQLKNTNTSDDNNKEDNNSLPNIISGQILTNISAIKSEHFTAPPKQYTEDTLLSAMETAGNGDYIDDSDVEKKGLGTPATRAGIIETLVKRELIQRDGKKLLPTEKGINLVSVIPDEIKSPKMTADWETVLQNIEKGSASDTDFLNNIIAIIKELIQKYSNVSDTTFNNRKSIGTCPKCGKKIIEYQKSYSCESGKDGCGFVIWKEICKKQISVTQAEKMLTKGKSDLIKGLTGKTGKVFDAYLKINKSNYIVEFEFQNKK